MGIEQLKENIQEQKRIVKKTDTQINSLESYANTMNRIIVDLSSIWDENADRDCLLLGIGHCVDVAAEIIYDYSTFSVNAINFLNQIDLLEALAKALIPGKSIKLKSFHTGVSAQKDHGKIYNFSILDSSAKDIENLTKQLDQISVETNAINAQIDSILTKHFHYKYSLSNISKRIQSLSADTSTVSSALQKMTAKYRATEKDLNALVNEVFMDGNSFGKVNTEVEKAYIKERKKNVYAWPEANIYTAFGAAAAYAAGDAGENDINQANENNNTTTGANTVGVDINDPSVFIKQSDKHCTHAANVMMLRRAAIIRGDKDWATMTEESTRSALWIEGEGMRGGYDYNSFKVGCYRKDNGFVYMGEEQKKQHLIELLAKHPEGVVIYDLQANTSGGAHAVLLTDYTDGVFYAVDPAGKQERVPINQTLLKTVECADQYWVIEN